MGQYYKIINEDKEQILDKSSAKLMESAWRLNDSYLGLSKLLMKKWKGDVVTLRGDYDETDLKERIVKDWKAENKGIKNKDGSAKMMLENVNLYRRGDDFPILIYNSESGRFKKGVERESINYSDWNKKETEEEKQAREIKEDLECKAWEKEVVDFYSDKVFYSLDKKEFINLDIYFKKELANTARAEGDWVEHPIPLLIATEHGGGGDFGGSQEFIGRYKGNRIGVCKANARLLKGFKDMTFEISFNESQDEDSNFTFTEEAYEVVVKNSGMSTTEGIIL